jgi:hypothetical protein
MMPHHHRVVAGFVSFVIPSLLALAGLTLSGLSGCCMSAPRHESMHRSATAETKADWRTLLDSRLAQYGHRNVIAIVDSAYPSQSKPGVEMIATGADQLEVVSQVLRSIEHHPQVRPSIMTDAELPAVAESDAPGIGRYRDQLAALLKNHAVASMPHEKIIGHLDETSATFNVLLLKTNLALPYTSVFIRLDCGYWSDDAEKRLRESLRH